MNLRRHGISLDFEAWHALANRDPERFEALRHRVIDAAIRRAPAERQQRLRCLQWRIDTVRRRSGSPLAATIRISGMMSDSLGRLHLALRRMEAPGQAERAPVIPLKRRGGLS